ncbi:DNA photolyase [Alcanivorax hongdengensis A-11-3]|uniref:Deoxyribodipyrimidine photo-lyase n=1 Tax=Alcanivorax hongdengensis A-11-3 TaxID=1177179 RepID=L0WAH5_9GAMM|nr:deoxyribodipyrimidine photo-lyase [Alcanivorax hongdengensis]EKF73999.1 DNA photolyase [Alcanivorax hongdengensis A-11-3]
MKLVWFRNDLRLHGHTPLTEALATGEPVMAVYCLCPAQWDAHQVAPLRRWYVLHSLLELGDALADKGVDLHVLECDDFAGVADALTTLVQEHGITALYCNREYPLNELNRDRAVADTLRPLGVTLNGSDDGVLVPPGALRTGKGTPYTVFGAYKRRWDVWMEHQPPAAPASPNWPAGKGRFVGRQRVEQALAAIDLPVRLTDLWQPGEQAALTQLARFADKSLAGYRQQRDFPALDGTSSLSTALSAGTLSVAACYRAAMQAMADAGARDGAACWVGELAWRDFYRQIMARFPRLARGAAFRPETDLLQWHDDEALFQAWCQGRTGYPLVDAAMRQLVATGWMHNRLRMLTAMFLSKHLWIDWRRGEAFFMEHLMDGDFAANNGGWQWSASTGTDAVPYFRVFSPVRQSQRFDPDGKFIARYVPELAHLDNKTIHEPWKQPLLAPDYPPPCVPHAGVRERVTERFKQAKADYDAADHSPRTSTQKESP